MVRLFVAVLFTTIFSCASLMAAKDTSAAPKQLGKFGDWTAYVMTQNGANVCYMVTFPEKKEGNYNKRGDVYTLVTHRPKDKVFNVVSLQAGYGFAKGATVVATIDGKEFKLFGEDETAWAPNTLDKELTDAMSKGSRMVVTGKSQRGTETKDTYSLKGSVHALRAINRACGR